jgi:hypothetical protein
LEKVDMDASRIFLAAALAAACTNVPDPGPGASSFPAAPFMTTQSDSGSLTIELRTAPEQPPARGIARVELVVTDAQGERQDGLDVASTLWMPAMGHGSSVQPTVSAQGKGTYVLDSVYLYMPGLWELRTAFSGSVVDQATPQFEVP